MRIEVRLTTFALLGWVIRRPGQMSNLQLAAQLRCSVATVQIHVRHLKKIGLIENNLNTPYRYAKGYGYLPTDEGRRVYSDMTQHERAE